LELSEPFLNYRITGELSQERIMETAHHAADAALLGHDGHVSPTAGDKGALPGIAGFFFLAILAMAALSLKYWIGLIAANAIAP
jgi:hypothetical protein